jgi:hypothetical protein
MKRVRRAFTREFKLETVRMLIEGGKSIEQVSDEGKSLTWVCNDRLRPMAGLRAAAAAPPH